MSAFSANEFSVSGFALSESKLDIKKLKQDLENQKAGALVTFEGWVRNHNDGKPVERLDYEAFEALAEKEGEAIIQEALARFEIFDALCVHRTGRLIIGDCAVWVGVTAAHRDAAFQASRFIIDRIKSRLPIWKKEYYKDQEPVWVNCQQCAHTHGSKSIPAVDLPFTDSPVGVKPALGLPSTSGNGEPNNAPAKMPPLIAEADYYQRQTVLPQIGPDGQRRLKQACVLVVGAGGLGSSALLYLAGAGVGHIGICEFDRLEATNLHRQILYTVEDVGRDKAERAAARLQALNPHIRVDVHARKLTRETAESLVEPYDLVLDCTDNFAARFLLNDVSLALQKPLIQAGIYQYEGQIHMLRPGFGGCLRCQWPDVPLDAPLGNCAESGVLGAVPGVLGAMQAMEAIKLIVGLPTPLESHMLIMDLLSWQNRLLTRSIRPDCAFCGGQMEERQLRERLWQSESSGEAVEEPDSDWQLEFTESAKNLPRLSQFTLIDVNEAREHVPVPNLTVQNIPFSRFELDYPPPLDGERQYLLYCSKGVRSSHLARELRKRGYRNVFALAGGLMRQDLSELRKRELEKSRLFYVSH